ncbi:MAG: porin [Hahellaceae bacterium]|nr:porin [Hahellaceae bacterium]MCP5210548.1 porin [Hahellaceae bacterium]
MKKTLIASAVAAAALSVNVSADAALPTVYGNIQLAWFYDNVDDGKSSSALVDNGSTIGFKHEHEVAPGVTAFLKAELEFDADDKAGNGGLNQFDEAYIGVKGDFGQVLVGSDDSLYENSIDIIYNFWEFGNGAVGRMSYDTGEGDIVRYETPSMGGLVVGGQVQINGDAEKADKSYPYQLAATYKLDNLTLALAMDSNDGDRAYSNGDGTSVNNKNTYGVRATVDLDSISITGEYQTRIDTKDQYGVLAVFTAGSNQFAAGVELQDYDNGNQTTGVALQALHNLSDNMYVWTEGYYVTSEVGKVDVDGSVLALGATYVF